ncbi:glycosyltransferase family 2 protein [Brevibacillus sp. SYP-B805]|uniref:glycosyltransferase family 2 protein n=1 Tax=Brevibacillus sp. SYP-B805 TaxID=1578199 RepID=UPI0013EA39F9|nr:glycosyltransferase family 2 protein [Brevibacillus sp. SYP-B805]NGQ94685.1 glycosyltransferase family 2 protein [Brevibacillus sp. SYP-B805]
MKSVSVIIPAYNEAPHIAATLRAVRSHVPCDELIVVDDGSRDGTAEHAAVWADRLIRLDANRGKGFALQTGWRQANGAIILLLDGDLRESAAHAARLLAPVAADECDMAIAILPGPARRAGFGLAKGLARRGIQWMTGFMPSAPLSGQRAVKREVLAAAGQLDHGFGIEVGLTIDALRAGFRVMEVAVPFSHRETGNDWYGCLHRGREFFAIGRALGQKWKERETSRWG